MFIGSGGGRGYYSNSIGSNGGGVLIINTNKLNLYGTISNNGQNGEDGGGGGAGGSLIINATQIYGFGSISVNGGDGGFSGGLISGNNFCEIVITVFTIF